jgi:hypothetical protein
MFRYSGSLIDARYDKDAPIMGELDAAQSPTQSAGQIQHNRRYANCGCDFF